MQHQWTPAVSTELSFLTKWRRGGIRPDLSLRTKQSNRPYNPLPLRDFFLREKVLATVFQAFYGYEKRWRYFY
jgi:hypothetical protein